MNDAGDVYPDARVWLADGKIMAIAKAGESLPEAAKDAVVIETKGVIYPGMIDLHNHPDYAFYPLMPITKKYSDRYEWRWYDDIYNKRITFPQELMTRAYYFDLGLEISRYGEYKALVGGATSIQGGGAINRGLVPGKYGNYQKLPGGSPPLYGTYVGTVNAREECLVRNIEFSKVERVATSRVDIGDSAKSWAEMQAEKAKGPLVVHLAEGASSRMAGEFNAVKDSGLLGPELIAIHGVGLTEPQLIEMAKVGAKLVWSPLSNFMLYGKTANVAAAKRAGLSISLAPDWAPSGSKSVLGELKVADLVNKHELKSIFTDRELVEMVTRKPAAAMDWSKRLGQISEGYLADVIVVDDKNADPYRNLIAAIEENIQMVIVRGETLYGDAALLQTARGSLNDIETTSTFKGRGKRTRNKMMAPNCASTGLPVMSVAETRARLQEALGFEPSYLAKKISFEQISKDLQRCESVNPQAKLSDPVTAADAKRMLKCRFGLPLEKTTISPLTTNEDPQFFSRLMKNQNLPKYLRELPRYYSN
jgi:cytosine/adenosine deaminase-related metal-dependent hydrolase